MSRSYICRCHPPINPTEFSFCGDAKTAYIFEGSARAEFLRDHLNKGVNVQGTIIKVFHLEQRGEAKFAIYSETPFDDLKRLGEPAHFPLPDIGA